MHDLVCIQSIGQRPDRNDHNAPWKAYFELRTNYRTFKLYAPNDEERDLWINGFHSILKLPVSDPCFKPLGLITKQTMKQEIAECVETGESEEKEKESVKADNTTIGMIGSMSRH